MEFLTWDSPQSHNMSNNVNSTLQTRLSQNIFENILEQKSIYQSLFATLHLRPGSINNPINIKNGSAVFGVTMLLQSGVTHWIQSGAADTRRRGTTLLQSGDTLLPRTTCTYILNSKNTTAWNCTLQISNIVKLQSGNYCLRKTRNYTTPYNLKPNNLISKQRIVHRLFRWKLYYKIIVLSDSISLLHQEKLPLLQLKETTLANSTTCSWPGDTTKLWYCIVNLLLSRTTTIIPPTASTTLLQPGFKITTNSGTTLSSLLTDCTVPLWYKTTSILNPSTRILCLPRSIIWHNSAYITMFVTTLKLRMEDATVRRNILQSGEFIKLQSGWTWKLQSGDSRPTGCEDTYFYWLEHVCKKVGPRAPTLPKWPQTRQARETRQLPMSVYACPPFALSLMSL